jgi:iron complex transport system substrate-binding protein
MAIMTHPSRIICLSEETAETLYLLGEAHRIAGISGSVVRPKRARREKPRVSAFVSANVDRILALKPDLVLGFSDIQANIACTLIRKGLPVYIFNQRSCAEILQMIQTVGNLVGRPEKAAVLVERLIHGLDQIRAAASQLHQHPKVHFEEWGQPMITAIQWVSELIEIAGGQDIFAARGRNSLAKDRIISDPAQVVESAPDIVIGSWCGKKLNVAQLISRPGFERIPAIRTGDIYEIKSSLILQPGPAALEDSVSQLSTIVHRWCRKRQVNGV